MPRVINSELLESIRKPSEMVDEMLDKQVEQLETNLGEQARGVGNKLLSFFVQNGNRIQQGREEVLIEIERTMGLDREKTSNILDALTQAGILRSTSGGRLEIANSFLARRAQQKVESENRVLRTIKATIQDRMSRNELLDEKYLNYIATSLILLDLNEEETKFVRASQQAIRRERLLLNIFRTLMFLVLIGMTTWAVYNYWKVSEKKDNLEEKNIELENAKKMAEVQREEAKAAREEAVLLRKKAEANEREAIKGKLEAEELRREAIKDRDRIDSLRGQALSQAKVLEKLSDDYRMQAEQNLALKLESDKNADLAREALARAESLNRIITSWNAASRSLQIEDPRSKALVAMEAYRINRDNQAFGDVFHPNIIKALSEAAFAINPDLALSKPDAHRGALRDIVFHPKEKIFFTTGSDGMVKKWAIDQWNLVGMPALASEKDLPVAGGAVHNALAIRNDGAQLLVGGELPFFQLLDPTSGKKQDSIRLAGLGEIFEVTFGPYKDFYAADLHHFYRYDPLTQKLLTLDKISSKVNMVLEGAANKVIYSLSGKYDDYSYRIIIDSLQNGQMGSEEISILGTPKEVDFGPISQAAIREIDDKKSFFVLGFANGRLMITETETKAYHFLPADGNARKVFKPHQAGITSLAFSPDGNFLAASSYDGSVSLWDLRRFNDPSYQPVIFDKHPGWVLSVAFSPDNRHLLAGCQDGSLYSWSIVPEDYASNICEYLRKSQDDARVSQEKLYRLQKKSVVRLAYDEMTAEEYQRYFGNDDVTLYFRQISVCN